VVLRVSQGTPPFDARVGPRVDWRWVSSLVIYILTMLLALTDKTTRGVVPGNLVMSLIPFLWNTAVWGHKVRPTPGRVFVFTIATQWTVGLVLYLATDNATAVALRLVTGHVLQGLLTAWIYQALRARLHDMQRTRSSLDQGAYGRSRSRLSELSERRLDWSLRWSPNGPYDLLVLAAAVVSSILLVTPLGVVPGVLLESGQWSVILTWWSLAFVTVFAGSACALLLYGEFTRRELSRRSLILWLIPSIFSVGMLYPVFVYQEIPSTWLLLVPSVWAGLTLRPWGAALHALVLLLACAAFGQYQWFGAAYRTRLATETSIDLILVVCVVVGVTLSLMQAEMRAQRAEAREQADVLELVLEEMSDAVLLQSVGKGLSFQNEASRVLIGEVVDKAPPQSWAEDLGMKWPNGDPATDEELLDLDPQATPKTVLLGDISGDSETEHMISLSTRLVQHHGEERILILMRDIGAQVQREEAMKSLAKTAAHDLKGPLAALSGWLGLSRDLLREGDIPGAEKALDRVLRNGETMRRTVDDWLDYSLAREGRVQLAPVDLKLLVSEVSELLVPPSINGGSGPKVHVAVNSHVLADHALTRQVFVNLLANSLKYAAPGQDPIIWITSEPMGRHFVRVDIADNGIGIPPGEENRIFEPFHRSPGVRDHVDGSGVGLAVCRAIVEKQGGRIWASTPDDGGAQFSFTLRAWDQ